MQKRKAEQRYWAATRMFECWEVNYVGALVGKCASMNSHEHGRGLGEDSEGISKMIER